MRKTNVMVESGLLAAIAVVMALIAVYIPVAGAFVNFIWPLPIIVAGVRNGLKWSLMTTFVAGIICTMFLSPLQAFLLVAVFGILGLILGECMHRNLRSVNILFVGSLGALLAIGINFILAFFLMGINPIDMLFQSLDTSLTQIAEFQQARGLSSEEIAVSVASYKKLIEMMRLILPGAFLLTAPALALINFWVAKKVLSRLGNKFQDLPPFRELVIPKWCLLPYGLSLITVGYCLHNLPDTVWYRLSVNIQMVFSTIFVLQGLSLVYWYVHTKQKPVWWAHVTSCLIFLQIVSIIVLWAGAFDCIADFRKLRGDKS